MIVKAKHVRTLFFTINHFLFFLISSLFSCIAAHSLETQPWLFKPLELQPQISYRFQNYSSINSSKKHQHYHSSDNFVKGEIGLAVEPYEIQMELELADTRKRAFGGDHAALTGRYLYSNDILGDPYSITLGGTYSQAWKWGLYDISSFHHGLYELELHTSIGRESSYLSEWLYRWWSFLAVGIAERGSPWIKGEAYFEKNYCDRYLVQGFIKTLWGLGSRSLHVDHFRGYGAVNHQSVEMGWGVHYTFCNQGTLKFEYTHRLYSKNFPRSANNFKFSYLYPFGL